jgi:hypothetical protein
MRHASLALLGAWRQLDALPALFPDGYVYDATLPDTAAALLQEAEAQRRVWCWCKGLPFEPVTDPH